MIRRGCWRLRRRIMSRLAFYVAASRGPLALHAWYVFGIVVTAIALFKTILALLAAYVLNTLPETVAWSIPSFVVGPEAVRWACALLLCAVFWPVVALAAIWRSFGRRTLSSERWFFFTIVANGILAGMAAYCPFVLSTDAWVLLMMGGRTLMLFSGVVAMRVACRRVEVVRSLR